VDFSEAEFRSLIQQKGVLLTWYQTAICPCSSETSDLSSFEITSFTPSTQSSSNKVSCPVCRGSGKIFHSGQQIRGIISSADSDFITARYGGYKDAVINITVNPEHIPSAGDRYVITDSIMLFNEVIVFAGGQVSTKYPIINREMTLATGDITLGVPYLAVAAPPSFETSATPLVQGTHFTVSSGKITFINAPAVGSRLSISYYMNPSYVAVSFPKTVRDSRAIAKSPDDYHIPLPLNFQAKLEFLGD
jgi:hypothetical protein